MQKWFALMKPGSFKDRHGNVYDITKEKLQGIVNNYVKPVAQFIVGHPDKETVPSFGFAKALRLNGDVLEFTPGKVVAEFAALVKKGAFPHVSAGLDRALTKLDHIAFLSAERPAINGLSPICEFSMQPDADSALIDVSAVATGGLAEFSVDSGWISWKLRDIARIFRALRDKTIETEGVEKADTLYPDYIITGLTEEPPVFEPVNQSQFSMPEGGEMDYQKLYEDEQQKTTALEQKIAGLAGQVAQFSGQVSTLTQENSDLRKTIDDIGEKRIAAEFSAYADSLITQRKLHPNKKQETVTQLVKMYKVSGAEFSASDSPLSIFKGTLESGIVQLPDGTHTVPRAEFSVSDASYVDITTKAAQYQSQMEKAGTPVTNIQAINAVTNG
jgi:hypothetical protein